MVKTSADAVPDEASEHGPGQAAQGARRGSCPVLPSGQAEEHVLQGGRRRPAARPARRDRPARPATGAGSRVAMVSETPSSRTSPGPAGQPARRRLRRVQQAGLDADPGRAVQPADQGGGRPGLQDLAVVHDGHPVAQVSASSMWWVVSTTVRPSALICRSRSHRLRRACGSSAPVGSSRNTSSGSCTSAQAMDSRWAWPPDSFSARSRPARSGRPRPASRRPAGR